MFEQYVKIAFNKEIAPDTYLMGFRSREVAAAAKPGQFVMIRVCSGIDPLLRRPFSIAGIRETDRLLILYRVVGKGTAIMAQTKEGERLSILGPLGKGFEPAKDGQLSLLVAGGIGIAPLLFLAQATKSRPLQLLMGFGSAKEIIALDQLGKFAIDVSIATDDGTAGHAGPVTDLLATFLKQNDPLKDPLCVFACGPEPMLKKVARVSLDRHISCQVSLEAAMACGLGACQGCAIKTSANEKRAYYHVCADGPVFPATAIDWSSI